VRSNSRRPTTGTPTPSTYSVILWSQIYEDCPILPRAPQSREPRLAFVTLQEACRDWSERLDGSLDAYSIAFDPVQTRKDGPVAKCKHDFDPNRADDNDFGNAILYRDDFGIDSAPVAHDLGSPAGGEQREMLCVKSVARRIVICSVHLTAGDDGVDARRAEAARAREILATDYAGYTRLIGGDLNDDPLSGVTDNFYAAGYEHGAHGEFKEVDSPCGNDIKEGYDSFVWDPATGLPVFFHTLCRSGEITHPGFLGFGDEKFDYLFVPPDVTVHNADATSAKYSDHIPLWADITVPDTPGGGGGGGGGGPVDRAPVVFAGPPASGDEGGVITLRGFASDDTAAPQVSWSYRPLEDVDPGTSCTFSAPDRPQTTFTCTDDGVFEVTLTATDGTNPAVSDSTEVTIRNTPPRLSLDRPAPWQVFRAGTSVALVAPFTDAGANDTHTCTINWDDGTTDSYAARSACDRTHVFAHAGMYTITASVADDDGSSSSASVLVIVYDPDAGFVTGGGTSDTGGHFQLNPKYLPHDQGPAPGNGKVTVSADDLDLRSTGLDWLVVTADGKAAVKGTGTLNGQAGYGFVAYTIDDPDALRLVVWKLSAGAHPANDLIYDNHPGAGYDLDVSQPPAIGSGSVQVHP
jgi:endonuclease/exonuclease/phosphatase family metal-dependent hydrolase